jgi:hypothetical protein
MSENNVPRYNFDMYPFGNFGHINLIIETKTSNFGYTTQYAIELSPTERQELITVLLAIKKEED